MRIYLNGLLITVVLLLTPTSYTLANRSKTNLATQHKQELSSQQARGSSKSIISQLNITWEQAEKRAALPPAWLAIPFIWLLLMIATGPVLYPSFWHQHYPKLAIGLASLVIAYYILVLHNWIQPFEALMDYLQFIALITALYMATAGILIKIHRQDNPALTNVGILLLGAILSNLIGTTGASMLLIRPYIRFNRYRNRIRAFHILFFILIVSNIGGCLSPIGDPPLFLGFLKGVPFFWPLQHNLLPWFTLLLLLLVAFYVLDVNRPEDNNHPTTQTNKPAFQILGKRNFIWLSLIIVAVFIDPHIFPWVPAISYQGHRFSFLRELILFSVAWLSYQSASKPALQGNEFSFEPLGEVVVIFIGIFGTILPALALVSAYAQSPKVSAMITPSTLYWGAGLCSSILDNAPTYLNFLAASMASQGADLLQPNEVAAYTAGGVFAHSVLRLKAISIASVFFGAMTYIGNGPNLMVKSIAEHLGVRMPSFFGYTLRFAIPLLLPLLFFIWLIYFFLYL